MATSPIVTRSGRQIGRNPGRLAGSPRPPGPNAGGDQMILTESMINTLAAVGVDTAFLLFSIGIEWLYDFIHSRASDDGGLPPPGESELPAEKSASALYREMQPLEKALDPQDSPSTLWRPRPWEYWSTRFDLDLSINLDNNNSTDEAKQIVTSHPQFGKWIFVPEIVSIRYVFYLELFQPDLTISGSKRDVNWFTIGDSRMTVSRQQRIFSSSSNARGTLDDSTILVQRQYSLYAQVDLDNTNNHSTVFSTTAGDAHGEIDLTDKNGNGRIWYDRRTRVQLNNGNDGLASITSNNRALSVVIWSRWVAIPANEYNVRLWLRKLNSTQFN